MRCEECSFAFCCGCRVAAPHQPALSETARPPASAAVRSSIPEGIYSGEVSGTIRNYVNGSVVRECTDQYVDTVTVNSDGLPLNASGAPPVVGRTLSDTIGDLRITATITSINASGNRLVIETRVTLNSNGALLTGRATRTYTFNPHNALSVGFELYAMSGVVHGATIAVDCSSSGTLTN